MEEKPRSAAPIIVAVLLMLPLLYVGSYLALATPRQLCHVRYQEGEYLRIPTFRVRGDAIRNFYWPLSQLDQTLRPAIWTWQPDHVDDQ